MKFGCSALAGHLHLGAGVTPELCALTCCRDFEFCNRIHADAIRELLVHTGVRYRLTVHCEIVLIRTLTVEGRRAGHSVCRRAGYGLEQAREIAAIEGDIQNLSS